MKASGVGAKLNRCLVPVGHCLFVEVRGAGIFDASTIASRKDCTFKQPECAGLEVCVLRNGLVRRGVVWR